MHFRICASFSFLFLSLSYKTPFLFYQKDGNWRIRARRINLDIHGDIGDAFCSDTVEDSCNVRRLINHLK